MKGKLCTKRSPCQGLFAGCIGLERGKEGLLLVERTCEPFKKARASLLQKCTAGLEVNP